MNSFQRTISWVTSHKKIFIPLIVIGAIIFTIFRPRPATFPTTEKVTRGDIIDSLSVSGTVDAKSEALLSFPTQANLTWVGVTPGDMVYQGQAIASIDTYTLQKSLQTALNNYRSQRDTFDQVHDNNANNTLQLQQQNSYAQSGATASTTNSNLYDIVKRILDQNQANLDNSVINVELANNAIRLATLVSPINGILVSPEKLTQGMTVSPATTFRVIDPESVIFSMDVDEADIGRVKSEQAVLVNIDAYSEEKLKLPINHIDFISHTTSGGGNAFSVEVSLPNTNSTKYRVGMNGNGEIILREEDNTLIVPLVSIVDNKYVYVRYGKKFKKTPVSVGIENSTQAQVTSGVREGDSVAIDPTKITPDLIQK